MAWFTYKCPEHGEFKLSLEKRIKSANCPSCGKPSRAILRIGTTQILEKLDNGLMGRAIERMPDIEEILNERADQHDRETKNPLAEEDD